MPDEKMVSAPPKATVPSARQAPERISPARASPGVEPAPLAPARLETQCDTDAPASLLEIVADAVVVTDSSGLITSWNDAATRLYGIEREEALGQLAHLIVGTDLAHDGNPDSNANAVAMEQLALHVLSHGSWAGQAMQIRRDGQEIEVELTVSLLTTETGTVAGSAIVSRDVTSALRTQEALAAQEKVAQSVLDSLPNRTAVVDREGQIIAANAAWRDFATEAAPGADPIGSNYLTTLRMARARSAREALAGIDAVLRGRLDDFEMDYEFNEQTDGRRTTRAYAMHVVRLRADAGGAVVSHVDITWQKNLERQLSHRATHDGLTNLPNRLLLGDRLTLALARAARSGHRVAVLFCDLDRFKDINDTLGHAVGDQVLVTVAGRLVDCCRESDWVTRFGGDEFVVVVEDVSDDTVVTDIAAGIRESITTPVVIDGKELFFGVSIGVAITEGTRDTSSRAVDDLLRDADTAMYRAKEAGRNRIEIFDVAMRERVTRRLELLTDLRRAVERDQLVVEFQPQFSVVPTDVMPRDDPADLEQVIGVEALVRWQHPQRGLVGPAEFIETAEEIGVICEIGEWVIRQSLTWLRQWLPFVSKDFFVSANLSALQLANPELPDRVRASLIAHGVAPNRLCLEITEGGLMSNPDVAIKALGRLRALGVRLAVDDFGTGYSSLAYLNNLPVDILKIDRSFIGSIGTSSRADALVRGIVELSNALGMITIAEGVESLEQLACIRRTATTAYQGFLRARPMPPNEITQMLRARIAGGG